MTQEMAIETVTFDSHGARLTGRLYHRGGQGLPGVLVTGSWMTVKEQMPAGYAPLLAEAGFAALTFDFRGFGESEGEPREVESPARKAEDLRAAARFLASHARVDRAKVGALAICASAGYAAVATREESDLRSIAMVAPGCTTRPSCAPCTAAKQAWPSARSRGAPPAPASSRPARSTT